MDLGSLLLGPGVWDTPLRASWKGTDKAQPMTVAGLWIFLFSFSSSVPLIEKNDDSLDSDRERPEGVAGREGEGGVVLIRVRLPFDPRRAPKARREDGVRGRMGISSSSGVGVAARAVTEVEAS